MKRVFFILILFIFSTAFADWEAIGPYGGPLTCVGVAPSNENILYVTTYANPSEIFRSTDGGASWSKRSELSSYIYCFAVDSDDPDVAYAGGNRVIYKTTDGGSTWSMDSVANSNGYIYGIVVHPTSPNTVFAAGSAPSGTYTVMAFFKSTDGGATWSTKLLHTAYYGYSYCLTLDSSQPDNIYVGGYYYNSGYYPKVYKSTDGGVNFSDASTGIPSGVMMIYSLAVHPTNSNIVYAGTYYGGVYRSLDGGSSWSYVTDGQFVSALATTSVEPNVVYAGTDTLIYKSTDAGASWNLCGAGYGGMYKYSRDLAAGQQTAGIVYNVDNLGCTKSTDGGASWFPSNYGMTLAHIASFTAAPSDPSVIYTEFEEVCIFKTTNSGDDWSMLPGALDCGSICEFAVDYTDPAVVLALEGAG